jgi:acyl carrier protein
MTENTSGGGLGSLFFGTQQRPAERLTIARGVDPLAGPRSLSLDASSLRGMDQEEMQQQILLMLACLQRRPVAEITAQQASKDGTLALDSMTAVWVIATVSKAFGTKLVKLSAVDRNNLRSVGGLASLLRQSIAGARRLAGAA